MAKGGPIGGGGPLLPGYPKGTTLAKKAAPKKVAGYTPKPTPRPTQSPLQVSGSSGAVSQRGATDSSGHKRVAPRKSVAPAYTSKAEPRSSGMEVNPSTGSTSRRGTVTSSGARRGSSRGITAKVGTTSKAGPRLTTAQKNKLRVDIRNKGAQGRASHQTPAEKAADPKNWAKIAADLGNVGDKRFRGARTGAKASPAPRRYAQATGRGRGSKPQKAK